jgi:hypothetical protein
MTFPKNILIVLFFTLITSTLHELNAMELEEKALIDKLEKPGSSDFQIYQLLSEATKKNPQLYLPEVTRIIALNVCELTKKLHAECYEKYGTCLSDPSAVLNFVENSLNKSMSQATIVSILKICLSYSDKLLDQIQYYEEKTVLHRLSGIKDTFRLDCLKILLLVAGDKAWDLIKMRDHNGSTVLDLSPCSSIAMVNELCNAAPNPKELWELICTKNDCGDTILYELLSRSFAAADVVKKLLSYAPNREEAWFLISTRNWGCFTLDLKLSNEVREILESYRPK